MSINMYEEIKQKRKSRWPKRAGILLLMVLMLFIGFAGGQVLLIGGGGHGLNTLAVLKKLSLIEAYTDRFYLNDYDKELVEKGIYSGYMAGLNDPYAAYYTKEEFDDLKEEDSGEYRGIGITVYKDLSTGNVTIEQVMKDQPAYQAGVKSGDIITAVDEENVGELTLTETVNLIKKGKKNSVVLSLIRGKESLEIKVKKTSIKIETVTSEMKEGKIGYISVSQFIENTDEHFIEAVDSLEKQGMTGLILDLRDNGGGLVDSCVNMVSRIIPKGELIVYTEDKNEQREEYSSNSDETLDIPIVILVNGNSASASEIFTGCLKDYKAATVVGSKTYGKGIVQNIMGLSDGSALKMTVSKYFTPKGNDIHEVGIKPDVEVEMTDKQWEKARENESEDTQLKKACELLKNGNAK